MILEQPPGSILPQYHYVDASLLGGILKKGNGRKEVNVVSVPVPNPRINCLRCYCLSGLSSAQHASNVVLGPPENLLKAADPMCNVVKSCLAAARVFFAKQAL